MQVLNPVQEAAMLNLLQAAWECGYAGVNIHNAVREMWHDYMVGAVDGADGNVAAAATLIGVHRNTIHRVLREGP